MAKEYSFAIPSPPKDDPGTATLQAILRRLYRLPSIPNRYCIKLEKFIRLEQELHYLAGAAGKVVWYISSDNYEGLAIVDVQVVPK